MVDCCCSVVGCLRPAGHDGPCVAEKDLVLNNEEKVMKTSDVQRAADDKDTADAETTIDSEGFVSSRSSITPAPAPIRKASFSGDVFYRALSAWGEANREDKVEAKASAKAVSALNARLMSQGVRRMNSDPCLECQSSSNDIPLRFDSFDSSCTWIGRESCDSSFENGSIGRFDKDLYARESSCPRSRREALHRHRLSLLGKKETASENGDIRRQRQRRSFKLSPESLSLLKTTHARHREDTGFQQNSSTKVGEIIRSRDGADRRHNVPGRNIRCASTFGSVVVRSESNGVVPPLTSADPDDVGTLDDIRMDLQRLTGRRRRPMSAPMRRGTK